MNLNMTDVLSLLMIATVMGLFVWSAIVSKKHNVAETVVIKKKEVKGFIDFETGRRVDINPITKREEFV